MASKFLPTSLVLSLLIAFAVPMHADDMLPPPPPGDDMMAPPPPGGDMMAPPPSGDMLAPPGGDMMAPPPPGGDMMAPPGDMMAPPGGDMMAPPPGGDMMAPPPGDMMAPPGGDMMAPPGGDMMAPPPGDMAPPPGDLAPPPADNLFPEEPKKEESHSSGDSKSGSYSVQRHDSLWKIAGKKKVYGDSFQWPILFIANREKIKDPDMIKPGWDLDVKRNVSSDEINSAVQKAKDTPRYEPHTAPRKRLPVDY